MADDGSKDIPLLSYHGQINEVLVRLVHGQLGALFQQVADCEGITGTGRQVDGCVLSGIQGGY